MRYEFETEFIADPRISLIPDVAYSPDGSRIAATYCDLDEVKILDARSHQELRTYRNPQARLDAPHGLVLTDRHLIVSNKLCPADRPSIFTVYDLHSHSRQPVFELTTPRSDLCEAHSLALNGNRLVATYAGRGLGALACYYFEHSTGHMSGLQSLSADWFREYGQPKGAAFNGAGDKLAVSFTTVKFVPSTLTEKWKRGRWLLRQKRGAHRFATAIRSRLKRSLRPNSGKAITNGLAVFGIDGHGNISETPLQFLLEPQYCRLENVHIVDDTCAVADTINNRVMLYRFDGDRLAEEPFQIIGEHLSHPHDACLSPDGRTLLVSNYGIKSSQQNLLWHEQTDVRGDKLSVFELRG